MFGRTMRFELPDGTRYQSYDDALGAVMDEARGEKRMLARLIAHAEQKVNDPSTTDKAREMWYWTSQALRQLEHDDFVPNGFREARNIRQL